MQRSIRFIQRLWPMLRQLALMALLFNGGAARAEALTIAAAADLKFALDDIVRQYRTEYPQDAVEVIYGSSGKFHTQIQQGAPYDLFFSADIGFAERLAKAGQAASPVVPYARGRIVLWSAQRDARTLTLSDLADPGITRIAIANPKHAPYGMRAEEALRASQVWPAVERKLVLGENIAQTAQFVQTGNAQVGIIALSLALNPSLAKLGGYALIPESLHAPLDQGFIITRRAADNAAAQRFAGFMSSRGARATMVRYGFTLPSDAAPR